MEMQTDLAVVGTRFVTAMDRLVLAATDWPDIADMSKATADELRAIWGPLLA